MSTYRTTFASKLKYYLVEYDISQKELARRVGVSDAMVSLWIHGQKSPRPDNIDKLCDIFHCRKADLLDDDVPTDPLDSVTKAFESLDPLQRQVIVDMISMFLDRNRKQSVEG